MKPIMKLDLGNDLKLGDAFIQLTLKVYPDECFDVENELELEEDKEAVRCGRVDAVVLTVEATLPGTETGLIGRDDLAGCLVSSKDDLRQFAVDHGMLDAAVFDLKTQLTAMLKGIETFKLDKAVLK